MSAITFENSAISRAIFSAERLTRARSPCSIVEPLVNTGQQTSNLLFKMADLINFVSKREIDAKKEQKRKAREDILKKASPDEIL